MAKGKNEKSMAPAVAGEVEAPSKKSRLKKIVIILVILIMMLSGAGAGAYWWFFLRTPPGDLPPEAADQSAVAEADGKGSGEKKPEAAGSGNMKIERPTSLPRSSGIVLPLPPVTVNLADAGGRRYLKLGMEVEANADISRELKAQSPRIRDAIIMLLAGKAFADI